MSEKPLCRCSHPFESHSYDWGCDAEDRKQPMNRFVLRQGQPLCGCLAYSPVTG